MLTNRIADGTAVAIATFGLDDMSACMPKKKRLSEQEYLDLLVPDRSQRIAPGTGSGIVSV